MSFDSPITTMEEAKRFFQSLGCSPFHMDREYPSRYEEYCALGISRDLETAWTNEEITSALAQLRPGENGQVPLWCIHSALADRVEGHRFDQFLGDILEASRALLSSLSPKDKLLVAETIVGRQALQYRPGLIFQSSDAGQPQVAAGFAELAHRLVASPFETGELEARREHLLSTLAETERICRLKPPAVS